MERVDLSCAGCGCAFRKPLKEVTRRRKAGVTRFFCTMGCYARHEGQENLGAALAVGRAGNLRADNRQDADSEFRYFLRKARARSGTTDLDADYLRELWTQQRGRCALSGIRMELPRNSLEWERARDPWKPSLDRIDPARPYARDNVRFVTVIGNLARGRFADDVLVRFCEAVVARQNGTAP